MPKQKVHKGLRKRVTVTATGRIKHKRAGSGHLMSSKNAKRRRKLTRPSVMKSCDQIRVLVKLAE